MKINEKIINNCINYAKKISQNFDITHNLEHIKRTSKLAVSLAKKEGANIDIVKIAAWLHDIGYLDMTKEEMIHKDHTEISAIMANDFLQKQNLNQEIIDHICECISSHGFSKINNNSSIEAKCIHDADKLDALGLRGIMRLFTWDLTIQPRGLTINEYMKHLRESVIRKENSLQTKSAKQIAKKWNIKILKFFKDYKEEIEEI